MPKFYRYMTKQDQQNHYENSLAWARAQGLNYEAKKQPIKRRPYKRQRFGTTKRKFYRRRPVYNSNKDKSHYEKSLAWARAQGLNYE